LNFVILSAVRREPNEIEGPRVPLRYRSRWMTTSPGKWWNLRPPSRWN